MFSILMSCYIKDNPDHLRISLDSILDQTILPREIVLVSDGDLLTDHIEVINSTISRCPAVVNFIWHRLPVNIGLGLALNAGLKLCTGEYIVRHDSDDVAVRTRLAKLKFFINLNPSTHVFGSYIAEFTDDPYKSVCIRRVPLWHHEIVRRSYIRNPMNHVSVCFRRDIGSNLVYPNLLSHEDYGLWLMLIKQGYSFRNIDEVHVLVRTDSNMYSRRKGLKYIYSEYAFCIYCHSVIGWSLSNVIIYFFSRLIFRLLPIKFLHFFYKKFLRSSSERLSSN